MNSTAYSYEAIREIFDQENRKGKIKLSLLPSTYSDIVKELHDKQLLLKNKQKVSVRKLTKDEKETYSNEINQIKTEIAVLREKKEQLLETLLHEIENDINNRKLRLVINHNTLEHNDNKFEYFHLEDYLPNIILSKLLCRNLIKAFKVKASNRHHIIACLKNLLIHDNRNKKHYIVLRTDIQHFYESIPQKIIHTELTSNPYLSSITAFYINSIFNQYNHIASKIGIMREPGMGIPRGIGPSAYLSEIVMRQFDRWVKDNPRVMFYGRYVDDMIIILSYIESNIKIEQYFDSMNKKITEMGLRLHPLSSDKSQIIEYPLTDKGSKTIQFLGYSIKFEPNQISFDLSIKRGEKLRKRIDNAFAHFLNSYRHNPRKARRDLIDALNWLSGNTCLRQYKHGIKTGLYYNNNHLSEKSKDLNGIQHYYISKIGQLSIDNKPFGTEELREKYLDRLKEKLNRIDFIERWKNKKMYIFSIERIKELAKILDNGKEKKEEISIQV